MKASEIRSKTDAELEGDLDDAYQELFNLRFQRSTGQLANTARVNEVRKDIARIKTVLREREIAADASSVAESAVTQSAVTE